MTWVIPAVAAVAVFFLAFVCAVVLLIRFAYKRNKARVNALAAFCAANGLRYTPDDPYGLPDRWPGLPFGTGVMRRALNVVTGEYAGRPLLAFDYTFTESSLLDDDDDRHAYGVVALSVPRALPDLTVVPENALSRIVHRLGLPDVRLGDEEFDRRWDVRCADPRVAAELLTPAVRAHLMAYGGQVCLRTVGSDLVTWGRLLDPAELPHRAALLAALADAVAPPVRR